MGIPGFGRSTAGRRQSAASRFALATALTLAFASLPAMAGSAADKATAREAATQGIGLYRAGKYAEALDRLKRAQALYDAPVHLLYIARCQAKLGQLVEASENYRLLDHYALPADAPAAWTSAVEDGRKELTTLEPRIPQLKIVTEPRGVTGAALTIDGAPVSAAVVGIERPTNPGKHHIAISAEGFSSAEADVELAEGQSKEVDLHLAATGPGTATAPPAAASTSAAAPSPKVPASAQSRSLFGFMGGLRIGVGIPTGTLLNENGYDIAASDPFNAGGALEIHAGLRIGRYFTPLLYLEGETLAAGDTIAGYSSKVNIENTRAGAIGLGLMIGSAPGKLGGFGEIDVAVASSFNMTAALSTFPNQKCDFAAKGAAIRFGGGAVFPVSTWLHITPVVMATLGRFTTLDKSGNCALFPTNSSSSIASGDQRTHGMLLIGVGGDVILGRDK